jgi:hypothetical protein
MKYLRFLICAVFILPISCNKHCNDSCCGETFEQQYTKIKDMGILVGHFSKTRYEYNFSEQEISNPDSAAIFIYSSFSHLAQNKKSSFNLFANAYACSPLDPSPTQVLAGLVISSDSVRTFNNTSLQPGNNIAHLFNFYTTRDQFESVDALLQFQNGQPFFFGSYINFIAFKFKDVDQMKQQTLTFKFNFDDGSVFSLTTDDFVIP